MIPWLEPGDPFPPLSTALKNPSGLLAAGADLSLKRLIQAYRRGIFPWFSPGEPILWWSPDPRMVLFPNALKVSRSLQKALRNQAYKIRVDTSFRAVISACAESPRDGQSGTWITDEMIDAYCALHDEGIAHCVETWIDGELVGGLYGIALGRVFYGESMFTRATDASKIAFVHLIRQLQRWQFGVIDCQMRTDHLARFGALEIARSDFSALLMKLVNCVHPATTRPWKFDNGLHE
ncbi:MAG: leucyl/phenylalanyl-tRNA--protein transferase [Pseudomonadota bacterium]|nr:leucyl/phenylalanyl-tRNA--protein transferase [Pseudomonadota bacterium]